ncbi:MAG: hypothetical protein H7Z13_04470 [Ferruginibacter sp.]|nr:hypothetical protein [Ferruginibacter sp.]
MKKILIFTGILISGFAYSQTKTSSLKEAIKMMAVANIPDSLLTGAETYWTISTVSSVGYVNNTPGSNYNTYKSGGGMIVKFRFLKENRFEFLLYVQANTYGTDTETFTQVNGTVVFSKDAKGQQVFTTHAEKGVYRIVKNGTITTRPIPVNELKDQHSNTYLWERTNFQDDPAKTYLLMVDMDAHPGVDISQPSTIDPSWVSKFHIPKK